MAAKNYFSIEFGGDYSITVTRTSGYCAKFC